MREIKKNVLITSAGRRVSLVQYFRNELCKVFGTEGRIYTCDLQPELAPACHVSDKAFVVGKFDDSNYIEILLDLCIRLDVGIIIPTIDTELLLLAQHRLHFAREGVHVIVSDKELIQQCNDKLKTIDLFRKYKIEYPSVVDRDRLEFPIFIKPRLGSSSKGLCKIRNSDELSKSMLESKDTIWSEYIDPSIFSEYTVDLYYDMMGGLKCVVPRLRLAVRGGEMSKGITKKNKLLLAYISERLMNMEGARGCITFQLFYNGSSKVLGIEINPRFGGGYPLSYLAGANYPGWLIREYLLGEPVSYFDGWEDNLLLLRHDAELVVHDVRLD